MALDWGEIEAERSQQLDGGAALLRDLELLRGFAEGIRSGRVSRSAHAFAQAPEPADARHVDVSDRRPGFPATHSLRFSLELSDEPREPTWLLAR